MVGRFLAAQARQQGRDVLALTSAEWDITDPTAAERFIRSGDVVVRLYESRGGSARGTLRPDFAVAAAHVTDLLENAGAELPAAWDGALDLDLRPFQILTVRLRRA